MGTEDRSGFPADGEGPVRAVQVDTFRIDIAAVTNAQFAEFIAASGYRTEAETYGWSYVFHHAGVGMKSSGARRSGRIPPRGGCR